MLETPVYQKRQALIKLKLAIRLALEHFGWTNPHSGLVMDCWKEYVEISGYDAYYKIERDGTPTITKPIYKSDASTLQHNSTPIISWTHTQGGFNR